jgi:glycosyltransferase 2 family protein
VAVNTTPSSSSGATDATPLPDDREVGLEQSLERAPRAGLGSIFRPHARARIFTVPPGAARVRRPTDITLLVVTLVTLVWAGAIADDPLSGLRAAIAQVVAGLPPGLDPVWQVFRDLIVVWAVVVLVLVVVRRHWHLLRDEVAALLLTGAGAAVVGRVATGTWPDVVGQLFEQEGPLDFPPLGFAASVAVLAVASPHLARPFRYTGRWLLVLGGVSLVALELVLPGQAIGAAVLGWAVAATVHLVFGSPGGLPSLAQVRAGLDGMGVAAEPAEVSSRGGVARVRATTPAGGDLDVKIYGRDAWDGQLMLSAWRFIWYRDGGPTLSLTRLQQVEHEAFLNLLAERRGVPVARVVAAGLDVEGNALLVTERVGVGLHELGPAVTDEQLAAAWDAVLRLGPARISHGAIQPDRIRVDGERVRLADFAGAEAVETDDVTILDHAQLLVSTAVVAGEERALAAAMAALGTEGLAALASYVQPAALPSPLRRAADEADIDVDELRKRVVKATDQPPRELQRLRRLTLGRLLLMVVLVLASWALISSLADIGIDTIVEAIQEASAPLLILAWLIGFTPRVANAIAISAAAPSRIPLPRLTALQFAITFVNLAMPSTAARVAVNIRFFQRNGVEPDRAVSIGVLDSVTGFAGQLILLIGIPLLGLGSLNFGIRESLDPAAVQKLLVVIVVAIVVAVLAVVFVKRLRALVTAFARRAWFLVQPVLTSPRRAGKLLAWNMTAELLFSLCMYVVLRAFGQDVGYFDVVLVNEFVALFAGMMPVPGGIGVTEAALTAGFIAIGVPSSVAAAAAITYRVITYYTPPIIGFPAFRWLQKRRYL